MPIYDFRCTHCGHQSEVIRKMSEANTTLCPQCNHDTFSKMLSAPSFQLNGTGWYATDFKGKKSDNKTAAESEKSSSESVAPSCAPGCACH